MTSSPEAVITDSDLQEPPADYGNLRVPDRVGIFPCIKDARPTNEILKVLEEDTQDAWYKLIRPRHIGIPHGGTVFSAN